MFTASLLFCWMAINGPQCLVAEDTYGPYPSNAKCQTRLEEMEKSIRQEMPYVEVRSTHCQNNIKGEAA